MPRHRCGRCSMAKEISIVHHADRRTDVMMPYAPGIVVRRGSLVFLSGVTAAAVYHSHPHREEEFDLPATMEEQAVRAMENLRKTLEAAGCTLGDLVAATRYLTDLRSEEHTSELQSQSNLVCRLLLEKKKHQHRAARPATVSSHVCAAP